MSTVPELTSEQRKFFEKLLGPAPEEASDEAPEDGNGVLPLASTTTVASKPLESHTTPSRMSGPADFSNATRMNFVGYGKGDGSSDGNDR